MIRSAEEFVRLRESEKLEEYERSRLDSASDETWLDVIERFPDFARWVAHNKTISEAIIRKLFFIGSDDVLMVLAAKRRTPADLLMSLAQHSNDSIRLTVAHNPRSPQEAIEILKDDEWERVREVVSSKREGN